MGRRRACSPSAAVGVLLVAFGALAAAGRIDDNSFFTHLATGRIIWDTHHVPRSDPYTFTALGTPWVVSSWLASTIYAGLEDALGLAAVRALMAVNGAAILAAVWALTRPAERLTARLLLAVPVLLVAFAGFAERPLLLGLLFLCITLLAADVQIPPPWLVPTAWCWVNVHGSWPLGGVALVLLLVGSRLDRRTVEIERRALAWFCGGVALGVANPYGPRLLAYPVRLLTKQEVLSELEEWQRPHFDRLDQQVFAVVVLVAVVALVRRPSWRAGLPLVAFVAAAVIGSRNVLPASLVLVPGAATGLRGWGRDLAAVERLRGPLLFGAAAVAAFVALVVVGTDPLDESRYPIAADAWLRSHGLSPVDHRVIAREATGNWWELRDGPTGTVFADDRVEVLPLQVVRDHVALLRGDDGWEEILERYDVDAVLWEADTALAAELADDPGWEIAYRDDRYVVAVPTVGR